MERTNDVRLHGEGVGALKVALTAADPSYMPPDTSEPCVEVSGDEAIPVRMVLTASYAPGWIPDYLIDGKMMTGWSSDAVVDGVPQTVTLDLGEPQPLRGVRWAPHVDYGMLSPSSIVVETSQNGEEYDEVARVDDYRPVQVQWLTRHFKPKFARYVRLTLCPRPHFGLPGKFQATLAEVEVLR